MNIHFIWVRRRRNNFASVHTPTPTLLKIEIFPEKRKKIEAVKKEGKRNAEWVSCWINRCVPRSAWDDSFLSVPFCFPFFVQHSAGGGLLDNKWQLGLCWWITSEHSQLRSICWWSYESRRLPLQRQGKKFGLNVIFISFSLMDFVSVFLIWPTSNEFMLGKNCRKDNLFL